jgi:hypothetical protein
MSYKIIDNFLDGEYFDSLVLAMERWEWYFQSGVAYKEVVVDNFYHMTHLFYSKNAPVSPHYDKLLPLLTKLQVECLIRLKANMYPNTATLHEHGMHTDKNFLHSGAILSLNTCDGYTKLKDGTKIDSIANRVLLFDPGIEHCSTTTTNAPARFNINMNYIQPQKITHPLFHTPQVDTE